MLWSTCVQLRIITKQAHCEYEIHLTLQIVFTITRNPLNVNYSCQNKGEYEKQLTLTKAFTSHCMINGLTESDEYKLMWQIEISHIILYDIMFYQFVHTLLI